MKYWRFFIIWFLLFFILVLLSYYSTLNPVQHFNDSNIPTLITPDTSNNDTISLSKRKSQSENIDQSLQNTRVETSSFNVLILGIDARKQEISRSDVIMLANVNPVNRKVNIVSIPRDTRVKIPEVGYTKINHAHMLGEKSSGNNAGTKKVLASVSELLQCDINYYVKTNFGGFEHIIDTIGGIEIELPKSVKLSHSDITLDAGKQHIDGDIALQLVRERYSLAGGDFGRQQHQFMVVKSIARKLLRPEHIHKIPVLIKDVKIDIIDTNFTESDVISLALMFKGMSGEDINYLQLPGKSGYDRDPLVKMRLYYWLPDLEKARAISEEFFK